MAQIAYLLQKATSKRIYGCPQGHDYADAHARRHVRTQR